MKETKLLGTDGSKFILVYEGYSSHCTYRTLKLFREKNISPVRLLSHTSHALQPLDVGVFSTLKNSFRRALRTRIVTYNQNVRNDIFTGCELLSKSYYYAVIPKNIFGGCWISSRTVVVGACGANLKISTVTLQSLKCATGVEIGL